MALSALILVISAGLYLFYLQVLCQKILRREFAAPYFQVIVNASRLEFLSVSESLEVPGCALDYPQCRLALQCDFLTLSYLLKNAANFRQRICWEERLLMFYFHALTAGLVVRHLLRMDEKPAIMKLTAILQYFANVIGERTQALRFDLSMISE